MQIGRERKFGTDFVTKMMLFDGVVGEIIMYGAEMWGWKKQHEFELSLDTHHHTQFWRKVNEL